MNFRTVTTFTRKLFGIVLIIIATYMMTSSKHSLSLTNQNNIDEFYGLVFSLETCFLIVGYYCVLKKSKPTVHR